MNTLQGILHWKLVQGEHDHDHVKVPYTVITVIISLLDSFYIFLYFKKMASDELPVDDIPEDEPFLKPRTKNHLALVPLAISAAQVRDLFHQSHDANNTPLRDMVSLTTSLIRYRCTI